MRGPGRRMVARQFDLQVTRLRADGRDAALWSLRVTAASVASYVAATYLFSGPPPLLAPLTALLVVHVTPMSLLASGLDRVVSVVAGVAVAVAFVEYVPLAWWSLGILLFISITLGQALRLRANLMEVPISAMLVLGVGSLAAESAAGQRIGETLVGAAVGVAANLLFPPKVGTAAAGRAIDDVADSVSELLTRAAEELDALVAVDGEVPPAARGWLGDARRINHDIPRAGQALLHAEQGRRLNVRAVGTPNTGPGLRQGLEALEHSSVAIRGMFRAVVDSTEDEAWPAEGDTDTWPVLGEVWRRMAAALDAFGRLVAAEADSAAGGRERELALLEIDAGAIDAVRDALHGLHEARTRLENALVAEPAGPRLELVAAVLAAVKRLLRELDLDQRLRRQIRLARSAPRRVPRPVARRPGPRPEATRPEDAPPPDPGTSAEAETQVLGRIEDPGRTEEE